MGAHGPPSSTRMRFTGSREQGGFRLGEIQSRSSDQAAFLWRPLGANAEQMADGEHEGPRRFMV